MTPASKLIQKRAKRLASKLAAGLRRMKTPALRTKAMDEILGKVGGGSMVAAAQAALLGGASPEQALTAAFERRLAQGVPVTALGDAVSAGASTVSSSAGSSGGSSSGGFSLSQVTESLEDINDMADQIEELGNTGLRIYQAFDQAISGQQQTGNLTPEQWAEMNKRIATYMRGPKTLYTEMTPEGRYGPQDTGGGGFLPFEIPTTYLVAGAAVAAGLGYYLLTAGKGKKKGK